MVSVALEYAYIHLASDLTQWVAVVTDAESVPLTVPGEVRTYAGGRRRAVRGPGSTKQYRFTFDLVDRADVVTLESWTGSQVMVRDEVGRKNWGNYYDFTATDGAGVIDANGEAPAQVTFTLDVVTHSEVV